MGLRPVRVAMAGEATCRAVESPFETDAAHVAIAAVHGADYLLTWNCRHIANAVLRKAIERVYREEGYEPPTICGPEELMDVD